MIIKRVDPFTGKNNQWDIPVTEEQVRDWEEGSLIQNAMPNLNPDQREFIMTGITPGSWDETFKEVM